jgi:hypothetical protein
MWPPVDEEVAPDPEPPLLDAVALLESVKSPPPLPPVEAASALGMQKPLSS